MLEAEFVISQIAKKARRLSPVQPKGRTLSRETYQVNILIELASQILRAVAQDEVQKNPHFNMHHPLQSLNVQDDHCRDCSPRASLEWICRTVEDLAHLDNFAFLAALADLLQGFEQQVVQSNERVKSTPQDFDESY